MRTAFLIIGVALLSLSVACTKESNNYYKVDGDPSGDAGKGIGTDKTGQFLSFSDLNLEQCVKQVRVGRDEDRNPIYADKNGDGQISIEESKDIKKLNCSGQRIADLRGIEVLENLEELNCSANDLGNMPNFHELKKLRKLRCVNNFFSDADCPKLAMVNSMGLETIEIIQQRDGRKLTCDKIKLVARIAPTEQKERKILGKDNTLNDVWGFVKDGEQYIVWGEAKDLHIVKVFDEAPYYERIATLSRGDGQSDLWKHSNHSSWGEYRYFEKAGRSYLYAGTEGSFDAMSGDAPPAYTQIFDLTDINNIVELTPKDLDPSLQGSHNITIDTERELLLLVGGTNWEGEKNKKGRFPQHVGVRIYSLEDPANPKYIRTVGKYYVHDVQIKTDLDDDGNKRTRVYLAHGSSAIHWDANKTTNKENRFTVYDITDLASEPVMLWDQQYPYGYSHNIWVTEDNTHVVVTGETSIDNQLSLWELKTNADGTLTTELRTGLNLQGASLAHNAFIKGKHIYLSHYSKGVQIAELYTDEAGQTNMRFKWAYDTFPIHNSSRMEGCWGVFPFTKDSRFFAASDVSGGLFLFRKTDGFIKEETEGY